MQPAKNTSHAPVPVHPGRSGIELIDDGQTRCRGWLVRPQDVGETDVHFLARINKELRKLTLPLCRGLSAGDDSARIVGIKGIRREGGAAIDVNLVIRFLDGREDEVLLDAHVNGDTEATPLVVPFVRTPRGIYILLTRESRYALYFDQREMCVKRRMPDGSLKNPRKGWINGFPRAFACRAAVPTMGEQVFHDTPVSAPFTRGKFTRAVKRVMARKAGTLFSMPGVRPVQFTFLDRMPENSGRSSVWISAFALEIAIDDPELLQTLLYGDPENGVLPKRFGPSQMKGVFVPWKELSTCAGRNKCDVVDALSIAAVNLFREALDDGRLKSKKVRKKKGE